MGHGGYMHTPRCISYACKTRVTFDNWEIFPPAINQIRSSDWPAKSVCKLRRLSTCVAYVDSALFNYLIPLFLLSLYFLCFGSLSRSIFGQKPGKGAQNGRNNAPQQSVVSSSSRNCRKVWSYLKIGRSCWYIWLFQSKCGALIGSHVRHVGHRTIGSNHFTI